MYHHLIKTWENSESNWFNIELTSQNADVWRSPLSAITDLIKSPFEVGNQLNITTGHLCFKSGRSFR